MDPSPLSSSLALGMMNVPDWDRSPDGLRDYVAACVDLGVTTFDHADLYGDYTVEAAFGEALRGESALWDQITVVTKCGIKLPSDTRGYTVRHYDTSYNHIVASAERSVRLLGTDVLDVFLLHRPDPLANLRAVAQAFETLVGQGTVRHVGVSNFRPAQVDRLQSLCDVPLAVNQVGASVQHRTPFLDGTLEQCQVRGMTPMAWSPVGGGRLFTGRGAKLDRLRTTLRDVGEAHGGLSIAQVAYAWLFRHPAGIVPVLGTGRLDRVEAALQAESVRLSRPEWFSIWDAAGGEIP